MVVFHLVDNGELSTVSTLVKSASLHESRWYQWFCNSTFLKWNGKSQHIKSYRKDFGGGSNMLPKVTIELPFHLGPFSYKWKHLLNICLADIEFGTEGSVDVLL